MRLALSPLAAIAALASLLTPAAGAGGGVISHRPIVTVGANQSNNWSGYNQGTVEQGSKLFNQISGDWNVPTATQHTAGQAEYSSSWIGIGGGCIDAGCTATDATLIQTGTEQDVSGSGQQSYSAWWEVIPGPSLTISNFRVSPGDQMHADITQIVTMSNVWKITLQDVTKGETFTKTVPYSSSRLTAEWIQETPLVFGTNGAGLAALPNLTTNTFSAATANGANAGLKASEEMQLVDSNNRVIALQSAPNSTANGFSLCTWATSC